MTWEILGELTDGNVRKLEFSSKQGRLLPYELIELVRSAYAGKEIPSPFRFLEKDNLGDPYGDPYNDPYGARRNQAAGISSICTWLGNANEIVSTSLTTRTVIEHSDEALLLNRYTMPKTDEEWSSYERSPYRSDRWRNSIDSTNETKELLGAIWHENVWVVIPVTAEDEIHTVSISYSRDAEQKSSFSQYAAELSDGDVETIFEWKGYFGNHSGVIDGLEEMVRVGTRYVAKIAGLGTGFIVGTVLRRLSKKPIQLSSDVLYKKILRTHKEQLPCFYEQVREINSLEGVVTEESVIVLVHGTLSSCAAAFRSLDGGASKAPMLAYEHDTFLSITDNAKELTRLIQKKLRCVKNILLIGHSRGGLVARAVAHRLKNTSHFVNIEVWTYGTPHLGTPLVTSAKNFLQILCYLGSTIGDGQRVFDFGLRAIAYFLPLAKQIPRGILQMEPGSDFLESLFESGTNDSFMIAHGGNYDINESGVGFGPAFVHSFGKTAFAGSANDLVVPTSSATLLGSKASIIINCAHSEYFDNQTLRDAILKWH